MTPLGELSLWVALSLAAGCALLSLLGGMLRRPDVVASGVRAAAVTPPFVALAAAALAVALLRGDFSLAYVASVTSANLPTAHRAAALWAAPPGALLVSALALALCTAAAARARDPVATAAIGTALAAMLGVLLFQLRPFAPLDWLPPDGTPGAPAHLTTAAALAPPLLATGAAAAAVPFSFALSRLVTRQAVDRAPRAEPMRGWALASWLALTLGLALAAQGRPDGPWSRVLLDGGALALWIGASALLHAVGAERTTRPARAATYVLAAAAASVILAAVLRATAGAGEGSDPGELTLSRLALPLAALSLVLLGVGTASRVGRPSLRSIGPTLAAAAVAVGGLAAFGVRSPPALVACALAMLAGAAALRDLARAARKHDRRLLGAAVAHLGVAMAALAFAGPPLRREVEATLQTAQALGARDPWGREWRFVSNGLSDSRRENYVATFISLSAVREGRRQALVTGEQRQYLDVRLRPVSVPVSVPGATRSLLQDIRVTLVDIEGEDEAHVRVTFVPLARLVWYGALTMLAGGLIALLSPAARRDATLERAA